MRNTNGYQSENERQGKNRVNRNTNISSKKRVNRGYEKKFHVLVVQNIGKEMYKKVCCTSKVVFFFG